MNTKGTLGASNAVRTLSDDITQRLRAIPEGAAVELAVADALRGAACAAEGVARSLMRSCYEVPQQIVRADAFTVSPSAMGRNGCIGAENVLLDVLAGAYYAVPECESVSVRGARSTGDKREVLIAVHMGRLRDTDPHYVVQPGSGTVTRVSVVPDSSPPAEPGALARIAARLRALRA